MALRVVALAALGERVDDEPPREAEGASPRRARERDDVDGDRAPCGRGAATCRRSSARSSPRRRRAVGSRGSVAASPTRTTRRRRSRRSAPRDSAPAVRRSGGRSSRCVASRIATAASRSRRAASRTHSRPRGRSRGCSAPVRSRARPPFRFLSRLRRGDGSYRYSVRYGATPVWVTAQVIPALTGRPFPLPLNSPYARAVNSTADILDAHPVEARVCELVLHQFGGVLAFAGPISTVRCHEDNVVLKRHLGEPGEGRVLVVDGGGSLRVALLGDMVAGLAAQNGWAGLVVNGCVRDVRRAARGSTSGSRRSARIRDRAERRERGRSTFRSSSAGSRSCLERCSTATRTAWSCSTRCERHARPVQTGHS